jgi:hypothetical protein
MTRAPQDPPKAAAGRWLRNTAEPSGELAAGDVVAVGDVLLAVARPAGWEPVTGPLTEVRASQHGTRPLPERSHPFDAAGDAASPWADEGGS